MSDTDPTSPPESPEPPEPAVDRAAAIRALADENAALVVALRTAQIPQQVGMAVASRRLAVELPALLAAQLEADLRTGLLAKRWDEVLAAASERAGGDQSAATIVAAIAVLLREQAREVTRHLAHRGKDWTAEAYRLEGQATALDGQVARLRKVADTSPGTIVDAASAAADGGTEAAA